LINKPSAQCFIPRALDVLLKNMALKALDAMVESDLREKFIEEDPVIKNQKHNSIDKLNKCFDHGTTKSIIQLASSITSLIVMIYTSVIIAYAVNELHKFNGNYYEIKLEVIKIREATDSLTYGYAAMSSGLDSYEGTLSSLLTSIGKFNETLQRQINQFGSNMANYIYKPINSSIDISQNYPILVNTSSRRITIDLMLVATPNPFVMFFKACDLLFCTVVQSQLVYSGANNTLRFDLYQSDLQLIDFYTTTGLEKKGCMTFN